MMTSVGHLLKDAREQQARTVAEIANELRITQRYVLALECGDLKNLPGLFFYKSFIRQYAQFLGIPSSDIEPALAAMSAPETQATSASANDSKALSSSRFMEWFGLLQFPRHRVGFSLIGLAVAMVACSVFYAWWSATPNSGTVQTASAPSTTPRIATVSSGSLAEGRVDSFVEIGAPDSIDVSGGTVEPVVLNLSAKEKTWLRITSDGQTIFSGILQPSESKVVKGTETATVKVGNAAGLEVRLNGKPIGPIGERGQVRTVRFTPENFEILPTASATTTTEQPNAL